RVFKTTDGGTSWNDASSGLPGSNDSFVSTLAIDPRTPSTVYAGTFGGEVFKTTNGGMSWGQGSAGLPGALVRDFAIGPAHPSIVYAASSGAIFKTTNGGTSWSDTSNGLPNSSVFVSGSSLAALVIDPHHPNTVYAGLLDEGVFKTTNGGTRWDAASEGLL